MSGYGPHVNERELRPKDLVLDAYGQRGIVYKRETGVPHPKWLARQKDARMRDPALLIWWSVIPLAGGGACVPEGLAQLLGVASAEDVAIAAKNGGPTTRSELRNLFPEHFTGPV
jgi:hypothetical protein